MIEHVKNILFHKGLATELDSFAEGCKHNLVILDDLMDDSVRETEMQKLFRQGAHHLRLSVLFITHKLFPAGCARTISLNTHYLVLFCNMRDCQQVVSIPTFDWSFQYLLYLPEVTGRYFFLFFW